MLNLMYITNNPNVAKIAENAGVNTIMVDMEYIGKDQRQGNLNTVQNHHTIKDLKNIRKALTTAELLVRINPINSNSENEINNVVQAGANIIMLPWFQTATECEKFLRLVNGRLKTNLLLESNKAVNCLEDILKLDGIDQMHIGLNDLSLCYGMNFMFELFENKTVDWIAESIKDKNIPFGIGGIAQIGEGEIPAEYIIREHYRLGSTSAILSRSFCNADTITDYSTIEKIFTSGISEIRNLEHECENANSEYFIENKKILDDKINCIVKGFR